MLYLHKKQSPAGHGRTNIALPLPVRRSRRANPFRDFSQKEMGIPAKFQRKKSLKKGHNQSILTTETI